MRTGRATRLPEDRFGSAEQREREEPNRPDSGRIEVVPALGLRETVSIWIAKRSVRVPVVALIDFDILRNNITSNKKKIISYRHNKNPNMLTLPNIADLRLQQQIAQEIYRHQIMQRLPGKWSNPTCHLPSANGSYFFNRSPVRLTAQFRRTLCAPAATTATHIARRCGGQAGEQRSVATVPQHRHRDDHHQVRQVGTILLFARPHQLISR